MCYFPTCGQHLSIISYNLNTKAAKGTFFEVLGTKMSLFFKILGVKTGAIFIFLAGGYSKFPQWTVWIFVFKIHDLYIKLGLICIETGWNMVNMTTMLLVVPQNSQARKLKFGTQRNNNNKSVNSLHKLVVSNPQVWYPTWYTYNNFQFDLHFCLQYCSIEVIGGQKRKH